MIRELDSKISVAEGLKDTLVSMEIPRRADKIVDRISRKKEVEQPRYGMAEVEVADGFEDLLNGSLGEGFFFNTPGTVRQLAMALALAPTSIVDSVMNDTSLKTPAETIAAFRKIGALSGMRIIDLGCGTADFAIAAHALGATVYGTDAEELRDDRRDLIDGHIVVDINNKNAVRIIESATGGNFDLVTENICSTVPGGPDNLKQPESDVIQKVGAILLKPGGYLYPVTRDRLFKRKEGV